MSLPLLGLFLEAIQGVQNISSEDNQRVFRVVRSIVRDDDEVEDVVQESYMRAFAHRVSSRCQAGVEKRDTFP